EQMQHHAGTRQPVDVCQPRTRPQALNCPSGADAHRRQRDEAPKASIAKDAGTTKKMISAVAAVTPAITSSKPRQPIYSKCQAAGEVAHIAPNVPSIMKQPLNRSMRSFGNHDTIALSPAINAPATPKPIKARPTTSVAKSSLRANNAAPPAATRSSPLCTRRGPKRSSKTPSGNRIDAKVKKYTDVMSPRCDASSPSSAVNCPAITALMVRKKYDRK